MSKKWIYIFCIKYEWTTTLWVEFLVTFILTFWMFWTFGTLSYWSELIFWNSAIFGIPNWQPDPEGYIKCLIINIGSWGQPQLIYKDHRKILMLRASLFTFCFWENMGMDREPSLYVLLKCNFMFKWLMIRILYKHLSTSSLIRPSYTLRATIN